MVAFLHNFVQRQPEILQLIKKLVEQESTSRAAPQLDQLAQFVAAEIEPFASKVELFPQSDFGTHLCARFGFGHSSAVQPILVVGHLDTVWPIGTLERLPFRITDEGTAHGPGIFDMKAGIAAIIHALKFLVESGQKTKHPVTLLLTCDEEIGSKTSRALIETEAKNAVAALVLEPPITGGTVKTGRKGIGGFTLTVKGRAAHAGLDPEKGVNALVEMAHQILRIAGLNDYARGISVNVGVVHGGTTSNVVPAEAQAKIDFRFWTMEQGAMLEQVLQTLTPVLPDATLEIRGGINRPPMERSAQNLALYEIAKACAHKLGFELLEGQVGGGSDGNFTAALGIPTLDGLGVDGAGAHAEHEHILIADIPRRTALLTQLLTVL